MAYEARKETVGEQPSKCGQQGGNGPFERRTQKANTVTDAEGNCWVANRNAEWNRQRRTEKGLPFRTSALRGVPSKSNILSNLRKGGCVNLRTTGGEGKKI